MSERCPIVDMLLSLTQQCAHDLALGNGGTSHVLDAATGDTRTSASAIGLALDARQCYPGHGCKSKIGKLSFSVTSVQNPQYTHVIVPWHMSPQCAKQTCQSLQVFYGKQKCYAFRRETH